MPLLAVVGAHLSGEPLNFQLTDRGARMVSDSLTAPHYRLYALRTDPPKPGLVRTGDEQHLDDGAGSIEVEVWDLDDSALGSLLTEVPSPLCLGSVELIDGTVVIGFLCEEQATRDCPDITPTGGWRAYLRSTPPT